MAIVGAVFGNLFIKWNLDSYILLRIRVIMCFLFFVNLVTFGFSGVLCPKSILRPSTFDAVSDMLLVYVLGAMQAAPFKNEMFPIWSILMVSFRLSISSKYKYDINFELKNMFKLLAVSLLNVKHGSNSLRAPLWLFWAILVVKSLHRIRSHKLASKSLWHGRSSELVEEYMGAIDHNLSNFKPNTLEGCKFLVYGESKKNIINGLNPSIHDLKSVVSLENIWLHDGSPLLRLRKVNMQKSTIKDLTLAFALSRLLRCRVEGGILHEDTISMTKELMCSRIISTDDNVVGELANILLMDLSFLGQYIHTGYPMIFFEGLWYFFFLVLKCLLNFTFIYLLGVGLGVRILRYDVDMNITRVAISFFISFEMVEVLRYMSSNWTMILLVCNYVDSGNNKCMDYFFGRMISSAPATLPEEVLILDSSRYDLLKSSSYSGGKLRPGPLKSIFGGMVIVVDRVLKTDSETVRTAVIRALARYMDEEGGCLPRHCLPLPRVSAEAQRYWSACLELPSCSHVILVWHIATSLCQVKLEQDVGDTNNTGLIRPWLSDDLNKSYAVASGLSSYCLYLLISNAHLLPDNVFASRKLLLGTIQNAHDILSGCNSTKGKYDELIALSQEAAVPFGSLQDIKLSGNILLQGAIMGKELIESMDDAGRWEILAEVWADILIQIAPSSKAEAHGNGLQFGVELVTFVWALLCHCGIEKSELWPEEQ